MPNNSAIDPPANSKGLLEDHLVSRIRADGPLTVADYMAAVLYHPTWGYYRRAAAIGRQGDFVTAPEISQMFGEMLGVWCYHTWCSLNRPKPFNLIELGPGRGTMMADIVRTTNRWNDFAAARRIRLVETNETLRGEQARRIPSEQISWHDDLSSVEAGAFVLLANEFFDCLPLQQFVRTHRGWAERSVGLNEDGELMFTLSSTEPASTPLPPAEDFAPNSIVEINPSAIQLCTEIATRVEADQGAALIIDYGYTDEKNGNTFQAVRAHKYADPLKDPGQSDLTAHVDFLSLAKIAGAAGAYVSGPTCQRDFLNALGVKDRAESLRNGADAQQTANLATALYRLTSAKEMGELFKVLSISPSGFPAPVGFEPDPR